MRRAVDSPAGSNPGMAPGQLHRAGIASVLLIRHECRSLAGVAHSAWPRRCGKLPESIA
jgi:hypothetical protein